MYVFTSMILKSLCSTFKLQFSFGNNSLPHDESRFRNLSIHHIYIIDSIKSSSLMITSLLIAQSTNMYYITCLRHILSQLHRCTKMQVNHVLTTHSCCMLLELIFGVILIFLTRECGINDTFPVLTIYSFH